MRINLVVFSYVDDLSMLEGFLGIFPTVLKEERYAHKTMKTTMLRTIVYAKQTKLKMKTIAVMGLPSE